MKAHLAKLSLALLSTVFLLGCQEQGSGPLGPDGLVPQFDRKDFTDGRCEGGVNPVGGHCHGSEEPTTGPQPRIAVCCSQKELGRNPAKQIAEVLEGSYSTLKAKRFNEMSPAKLAGTYDVLIFYWKTSENVNADWTTRLLPYMAGGGGIIFEDPNNLTDLAAGVSTKEVQKHTPETSPITITIESVDGLTTGTVPNLFSPPQQPFINNHIIFNVGNTLKRFLTLTNDTDAWPNGAGEAVGLYGEFTPGRIVLTGLDNDYHGRDGGSVAQQNHYNLLFNEIVWVLGSG